MEIGNQKRKRDLLPGLYTFYVSQLNNEDKPMIRRKLFFGRAFRDQDGIPETATYNMLEEVFTPARTIRGLSLLINALSPRR